MKYIWYKSEYEDIWKVSEDYFYTIYYKNGNYITNYTCKTPINDFNFYKKWMKFKEISEVEVFLDML